MGGRTDMFIMHSEEKAEILRKCWHTCSSLGVREKMLILMLIPNFSLCQNIKDTGLCQEGWLDLIVQCVN